MTFSRSTKKNWIFDFINNYIPDELKRRFTPNTTVRYYETHFSQVFHSIKQEVQNLELTY